MVRTEPEKKSDIVRRLLREGDVKKALRIAKDFQLGITYRQRDAMRLAYECMVNERFYLELGTDIKKVVTEGVKVVTALYGEQK
ncbi:MAG: hypothetical protein RSC06_00875 [Clostridia bacterium]